MDCPVALMRHGLNLIGLPIDRDLAHRRRVIAWMVLGCRHKAKTECTQTQRIKESINRAKGAAFADLVSADLASQVARETV